MMIFAFAGIILALLSFYYFQMPMFAQKLPLSWITFSFWNRNALRILALLFFAAFISTHPGSGLLISISIPFAFFWVGSFLLSSSSMFTGLAESHITQSKTPFADKNTEIVGFANEAGNARAYPIYEMISPRHIVHDSVGMDKILVTYCPACGSCMIFDRVVDGRELTFEVGNGIYRRNMLMKDTQTGTLWQQGTGEAISGKLKGALLNFLPYQQMTAENWGQQYPDSLYVYEKANAPKGLLPQKFLAKLLFSFSKVEGPPHKGRKLMPFNTKIWGLNINGQAKAYPIAELKKAIGPFTDKIGNLEFKVLYNSNNNSISGFDISTNAPLTFQNHWWIGWVEFHPNTEIWHFG